MAVEIEQDETAQAEIVAMQEKIGSLENLLEKQQRLVGIRDSTIAEMMAAKQHLDRRIDRLTNELRVEVSKVKSERDALAEKATRLETTCREVRNLVSSFT